MTSSSSIFSLVANTKEDKNPKKESKTQLLKALDVSIGQLQQDVGQLQQDLVVERDSRERQDSLLSESVSSQITSTKSIYTIRIFDHFSRRI
jgi:hypothetical protein